jgi:pimeloyl-ACP methyl ester carboxylesterase
MDKTLTTASGAQYGFIDYGPAGGTPVLWCHGGPGSRFEPEWLAADAAGVGLRIIGFDRPGYGLSPPQPGRTIVSVVSDLLELLARLDVSSFLTVGVSTGGVYALAAAALAPARVLGVLMCGAMTDMSFTPARMTMHVPQVRAIWDAPSRDAAIAAATDAYGEGFSKLLDGGMSGVLAPSDAEIFADRKWMTAAMRGFPANSTFGMQGYVDDRIADGPGWGDIDLAPVTCPVTVLHGGLDQLADVMQAKHSAELVPHARLVIVPDAGHFSIERDVVAELTALLASDETQPRE